MSLITRALGLDRKIEELEARHKKELVELENAYLGEMAGLGESLKSELAAEVEGWYGLGKAARELEEIDRKTLLEQCWNAFCKSPLCKAIVKYTTIFVFGKGITYEIDNPEAQAYVDKFYQKHRLDQQQKKLSNELQIYGELFLYFPESKMVTQKEDISEAARGKKKKGKKKEAIIREAVNDKTTEHPEVFDFIPVDPAEIDEIETDEYDIRKVKRYKRVYTTTKGVQVTDWIPGKEIQHIAINCASNSKRGRSDLESIILWSFRYNEFLKNRSLLNKMQRAIFFDVTVKGSPTDVAAEKAKYPHGPKFGTVLFHNEAVVWKVVEPKIDARSAEADGRALRQMIAVGALLPEYMLSEGRGTTYTTGRVQEPVIMQKFTDYQDLWEAEFITMFRHIIALGVKYEKLRETYKVKTKKGEEEHKTVDVPIRCHFPELKRVDILELAKTMALLLDIGLSRQTVYGVGGYDYQREQRQRKEEESQEETETFEGGKFKAEGGEK